jgi:hypothetical protein
MSVLVDTCVWSALLRRRTPESAEANELQRLIISGQAKLIGAIRQELLAGIRHAHQVNFLRDSLREFDDLTLRSEHYELAAEFTNRCIAHGVQGNSTDFLICAVAEIEALPIFTTDLDFTYYARHLPIRLHA